MQGWEKHFKTSDFIEAMEQLVEDNHHPLESQDHEIVEVYEGDSKNPPHVVIEITSGSARARHYYELYSERWWGWFVDLDGDALYFEPYG